jgi:iron complex outermembrane receptor protein
VNVDGEDMMAFQFRQNNARLYGFETKIDIHPHPLDWLHLASTFSYVAGKFNTPYEGNNRLPFIPPARWTTELRGDFAKAANGAFRNFYVKLELDNMFTQNRVFTTYNTETATQGFSLLNFGIGADIQSKGRTFATINLAANNITDVAYQNHLSRLKYTADNLVTRRSGVFNMGRNFTLRLNIPLEWKLK